MTVTKEKIAGYAGAALFCGLLLFLLYSSYLSTQTEAKEQGVLVNFGNVDWASGTFEPHPEENRRPVPVKEIETDPPAITQEVEETVEMDASEQQRTRERREQEEMERQERQRQEDERRRIETINRQMQGAFGVSETVKGSEGTAASSSGNQGSEQGNAPAGAYVGVGGYGGFDLVGRTLGAGGLPRPAYSVQEEGKIVINITVDPQGKVISAEIGRGTNITNPSMRNSALEAARKAKFNIITGNNNQSGTITYNYRLN
jgi:TonB family protein